MRTYSPSPTVVAPGIPLYQMGFLDAEARRHGARRRSHAPAPTVYAPRTPLYLQGWQGLGADVTTTIVGSGGAVASAVVPTSLVSSGAIAAGSLAVPLIGAGIAIVTSVILGLWAAHEARVKGAQTENAQVSSAVQAFDGGMRAIFDAANSNDPAKNISASQAAQAVQQLYSQFWASCCNFTKGPGRADTSNCGANCGGPTSTSAPCAGMPYGHKCDKSCTVSCCVGCQDIKPSVDMAVAVFQAGGGTVEVCNVAGDHYGLSSRGSYSLTYTKPTIAQSAGGILSSITGGGGAASLLSPLSPSGGGSILPLLAVAALAIFAVRSL
jgi:hypothetical protein